MKRSTRLAIYAASLLALTVGVLSGERASQAPGGVSSDASVLQTDPVADPAVAKKIHEVLKGNVALFDASLQVRENVDFLLTPALLMQEVVTPTLVITYPKE